MSDNKIKVSVIVPCYNAEKFLDKCLDTLRNQTLEDIEIICVNDCSKDNTAAILDEYAKKDARIKAIHLEKNQGQSTARNVGLKAASGDFISFVDSDDYIDLTMLEKLYSKALKCNADLAICNIYLDFVDTGKKEVFRDSRFYTILSGRTFLGYDFPALTGYIGVWDRIYKRELIINNNLEFPVGLVYEDHLFCIQSLMLAERVCVVNEPLYYYRKNAGGSITDNEVKNDKYKFDYIEISKRIKQFLKDVGVYEDCKRDYLKYHFFYATIHQSNTKAKNFAKFFEMMREITSDEDYKTLEELNLTLLQEIYLKALKNNDLNSACRAMKSYAFARKVRNAFKKSKKAGK